MPTKGKVGDTLRVTQGPFKRLTVIVKTVMPDGALVTQPDRPGAAPLFVPWTHLKPPPSPAPSRGVTDGKRDRTCKRCGKGRCECLEIALITKLGELGVVVSPENREYEFANDIGRKWRADFVFFDGPKPLLVEVEGGAYRSRHRQAAGFAEDLTKYNHIALHTPFTLLRYDTAMVTSGRAAREIAEALGVGVT